MKTCLFVGAAAALLGAVACSGNAPPETTGSNTGAVGAVVARDTGCVGFGSVLCINGGHWDPSLCRCVLPEAGCVDNVLCVAGDVWDPTVCRCVPRAACETAADCRGGPLPLACEVCSDGLAACAHWTCENGTCELVTCQP
jgi:hypothetical protein